MNLPDQPPGTPGSPGGSPNGGGQAPQITLPPGVRA
jgi:hypothetical protein